MKQRSSRLTDDSDTEAEDMLLCSNMMGDMVATKNHKPALIINALKIHKFMRIYLFVGRHYPMYIYEYPIIIKLIQGTVSESRAILMRLYNTYFTITLQFLLSTTNEP